MPALFRAGTWLWATWLSWPNGARAIQSKQMHRCLCETLKLTANKNLVAAAGAHQVGGVRSIAVFEALKGLVVLLAGFGLLHFVHRDLQSSAEELVRHSHLNPAHHYPRIFIEAASRASSSRIRFFAAMAFLYSTLRFVEAYGLWRLRAWAEWFAIVSGSIYLPIEIFEFVRHATWIRALVFVVNAFIVLYLIYIRWQGRKARKLMTNAL
jgi:uncharacterized membrane protein (DUF2068 family)